MAELSINELILQTEEQFKSVSDTPRLDAELLLIESFNHIENTDTYNRSYLRTWPEKSVSTDVIKYFNHLSQQRLQDKPIAYILKRQDFWHFNLSVTEDTLIPRADTETLVETALELLPDNTPLKILDLGTGSGAIALALAYERPLADVFATDIHLATLQVAQINKEKYQLNNQLNNLHFLMSDWLSAFKYHQFDMIISNPPYIAPNDPHLEKLKYEPWRALVAENNGLNDYQKIIPLAKKHLKANGLLLVEHGYNQHIDVKKLFTQANYLDISQNSDYAKIIRVTYGINNT